jgi:hypothetical protein
VRYLVEARHRRRRASDLVVALSMAAADRAHAGRITLAYPRTEVRLKRVVLLRVIPIESAEGSVR